MILIMSFSNDKFPLHLDVCLYIILFGVRLLVCINDVTYDIFFHRHYDTLSKCAEETARNGNCFWPNNLAERFIIGIHSKFFLNCTLDTVILEDPPDDILTALILVPVFLTAAMISLVVWCSKRGDVFG